MKHNYSSSLRRTLSAVLLLLVSTLSWAYDFEAGGIYYNINDDGTSVTVTSGTGKYSGDIVIPSTVVNDGNIYSVTGIGKSAFRGCTSLTSISLSSGLTGISNNAFWGCSSLTSISLPSSLTSIGDLAFYRCSSLTSIEIPDGVTNIESGAFYDCSSLTSMTVAAGNQVYDSREGCNAIIKTKTNMLHTGCKSTVIPSSVKTINSYAFCGCSSLTSIEIPESVTYIGGVAFCGCSSLTSIEIPDGVKNIENNTFSGCTSLTSISLPKGLKGIKQTAFFDCRSLTSIEIPDGVKKIEWMAFSCCSSLTTVICRAKDVPVCGTDVFSANSGYDRTLYVPSSSIDAYKVADGWKDFYTILPLEDYETGIDTPSALQPDEATDAAAPYYTLGGQRVNAPVRGHIYIRSGRKVIY